MGNCIKSKDENKNDIKMKKVNGKQAIKEAKDEGNYDNRLLKNIKTEEDEKSNTRAGQMMNLVIAETYKPKANVLSDSKEKNDATENYDQTYDEKDEPIDHSFQTFGPTQASEINENLYKKQDSNDSEFNYEMEKNDIVFQNKDSSETLLNLTQIDLELEKNESNDSITDTLIQVMDKTDNNELKDQNSNTKASTNEDYDSKTYVHDSLSVNIRSWFKEHTIEDTPYNSCVSEACSFSTEETYRGAFMGSMVLMGGLFVGKYFYQKFFKKSPAKKCSME